MKRVAAAFLALFAAACDPGWHGEGHLIDGTGAPVGAAKVSLVCPAGLEQVATAGLAGDFSFGGVGTSFEAAKCTVKIEKPGYVTRTVRTLDLCYHNSNAGNLAVACTPGEGTILLSADPSYVADGGADAGATPDAAGGRR